jgi:hypothetical protein
VQSNPLQESPPDPDWFGAVQSELSGTWSKVTLNETVALIGPDSFCDDPVDVWHETKPKQPAKSPINLRASGLATFIKKLQ